MTARRSQELEAPTLNPQTLLNRCPQQMENNMATGNPTHLLKLADREFKALTEERPTPQPTRKFKSMKLNAARFDQSWDRKRGAAARMTAVVLRADDATLERRVCESERSFKTYSSAADWLQRESAYLRKMARLLDAANERLATVLGRCRPELPKAE
jgi:hypothetical protein